MAIGEPEHEEVVGELITFFNFDRRLEQAARLAQANTPVSELRALLATSKSAIQELSHLLDRLEIEIEALRRDFPFLNR